MGNFSLKLEQNKHMARRLGKYKWVF